VVEKDEPTNGIDIADDRPHADEFYEGTEVSEQFHLAVKANVRVRERWLDSRPEDLERVPSSVIGDPTKTPDDVDGIAAEYARERVEEAERIAADEAGDDS